MYQQQQDEAKIASFNRDRWKQYKQVYERVAEYLVNLTTPTVDDIVKGLRLDNINTNNNNTFTFNNNATNTSTLEEANLVRIAFYCAFYTVVINNNRVQQDLDQQQQPQEKIYINDDWLYYFTDLIKTKSRNECLFRIKSFKKKVLGTSNTSSIMGGNSSSTNKFKSNNNNIHGLHNHHGHHHNLNNNNSLNGGSDNILNSFDNSKFRNGYFIDDLEVDSDDEEDVKDTINQQQQQHQKQQQSKNNQHSSKSRGKNNINNQQHNHQNNNKIVDITNSTNSFILKYRYEKDFVIVKDGIPHVIVLSPDWGTPFHFKDNIVSQPTIQYSTNTSSPTRKKQKSDEGQDTSNGSWCSIM